MKGIFKKQCIWGRRERERGERKHSATGKLQRLGKEKREKANGGVRLRSASGLQHKCPSPSSWNL